MWRSIISIGVQIGTTAGDSWLPMVPPAGPLAPIADHQQNTSPCSPCGASLQLYLARSGYRQISVRKPPGCNLPSVPNGASSRYAALCRLAFGIAGLCRCFDALVDSHAVTPPKRLCYLQREERRDYCINAGRMPQSKPSLQLIGPDDVQMVASISAGSPTALPHFMLTGP